MDLEELVFNTANAARPAAFPAEWEVIPLIDGVSKIDYGLSQAIPKTPPPNGVKIVSTADITPDGELLYWKIRPTKAPEKIRNRLALVEGDVLFNWRNSANLIGKTAIYHQQNEQHIFASFILRIDCRGARLDNYFLKYLMRYYREQGVFMKLSRRAVNQANYNKNEISVLRIPLPPLAEQKKIAHILSTVQRAIEAQERIIQTTTELKKALMHKLFTEGLRHEPQKQTEIGPVPESWEVVELETVCELVVDCPHTTPKFLPDGVRVARNFNIRDGRFVREPAFFTSEEQYLERVRRAVPKPGDVLFSREAPVGEACVIPDGLRLSLGQRTMLIRADRKRLIPEFLVYTFYSPVVSAHMKSTASGLTVAHLNVADVRRMPLPLPSLSVQSEIAAALLAIDNKGEQHRAKRERLQDLFRTLLHELMTAKTRVHELDLKANN